MFGVPWVDGWVHIFYEVCVCVVCVLQKEGRAGDRERGRGGERAGKSVNFQPGWMAGMQCSHFSIKVVAYLTFPLVV